MGASIGLAGADSRVECNKGCFQLQYTGSQLEEALALLEQMQEASVTSNVISFSAAISACEKGGQWHQALVVVKQLQCSHFCR